jgi:IS5 family transposase
LQIALFSIESGRSIRHQRFQLSELGQLRSSLPIKELAALLPCPKSAVGSKSWFDNEGKVALQFLKVYEGCSDEKLRARLNTDWSLQMFCGIQLQANEEIKDSNLLWQIRKLVAHHLKIESFQSILITHWKKDMQQTHIGMSDASCYESYIKYPTDVNLLWDTNQWIYGLIRYSSKTLKRCLPRNKFSDQRSKQLAFARCRRKTKKRESLVNANCYIYWISYYFN